MISGPPESCPTGSSRRSRSRSSSSGGFARKLEPRPRLAARARERRPVHERLAPDRRTATRTGQSLAAIHGQRSVEVAALTVDVDVESVEARAANPKRFAHHIRDLV